MNILAKINLIAFILLAPLLPGCLIVERTECTFTPQSKDQGIFQIHYSGIKSNRTKEEEIQKDFEELKSLAKPRKKLKTTLQEDGFEITERKAWVDENQVLHRFESGFFSMSEEVRKKILIQMNEEILSIHPKQSGIHIETNGKITETEEHFVLFWPDSAKELKWTVFDENAKKWPNNLAKRVLDEKPSEIPWATRS